MSVIIIAVLASIALIGGSFLFFSLLSQLIELAIKGCFLALLVCGTVLVGRYVYGQIKSKKEETL